MAKVVLVLYNIVKISDNIMVELFIKIYLNKCVSSF